MRESCKESLENRNFGTFFSFRVCKEEEAEEGKKEKG